MTSSLLNVCFGCSITPVSYLLETVLPGHKLSQVIQSEPKSQIATILVYLGGSEDYCSTQ